jgi:predicted permease
MGLPGSEKANIFALPQPLPDSFDHGFNRLSNMVITAILIVMGQRSIEVNADPSFVFIALVLLHFFLPK